MKQQGQGASKWEAWILKALHEYAWTSKHASKLLECCENASRKGRAIYW